jgi:hypothetical protein
MYSLTKELKASHHIAALPFLVFRASEPIGVHGQHHNGCEDIQPEDTFGMPGHPSK